MEFTLKAGATIDVLTADELESRLAQLGDRLADQEIPMDVLCDKIVLPSSGHLAETQLWTVPTGMTATIHRIAVSADGYTPGAPLSTAGAWMTFWRNGVSPYNLLYPLPAGGSAVLPAVITEGKSSAPPLRNGETLVASGELGTVTANIGLYVALLVHLKPLPKHSGRSKPEKGE